VVINLKSPGSSNESEAGQTGKNLTEVRISGLFTMCKIFPKIFLSNRNARYVNLNKMQEITA
jgi:hypothetical protein